MSASAKPVSRYTTGARINHWVTAVSLILLAVILSGSMHSYQALLSEAYHTHAIEHSAS